MSRVNARGEDSYFNSIKVRLKRDIATAKDVYDANFNSIKVRLKHTYPIESELILKFQFHKGTIKTGHFRGCRSYRPNFNSIKVRLKQLVVGLQPIYFIFQFHKGTIKTYNDVYNELLFVISIP